MTMCRILETNMVVRDRAGGLLGKLVLMGIDPGNRELLFAVLEVDVTDQDKQLLIVPRQSLKARRVNQPDEIILDLSGDEIRQAVERFGFHWPDTVCPDWAAILRRYFADHSACELESYPTC